MTCACIQVEADSEPLKNLLRWVAPSVPEVPYDLAIDYMRQAYIDFARRTKLVTVPMTLTIQKGVKNYELKGIDGYEVYAIKDINWLDFPYQRYPDAHHWYYAWGCRFRVKGNRELVFAEEPGQDGNYEVILHLIPSDCVDSIFTELSTPFGKGIAMGALADILEIPNKPWTNFQLAAKKKRDFDRTVLDGRRLEITNRGAKKPTLYAQRIL